MPAGWYDDPRGVARLRWWDGSLWTEHGHGPAAVALRGGIVAIVVLVVVRISSELLVRPLSDTAAPLWLVAVAFYVVVYGVMTATAMRWLRPSVDWRRWLRREVDRSDLWRGALVWLSTIAVGVVAAIVIQVTRLPMRSNGDVLYSYRERNLALFAISAIAAIVVAPVVEELYFRALVQRGLASRLRAWQAIVVQGSVFGVYHVIPRFGWANVGLVLVLSCYGWAFGAWAQHTGRVGPTMVGHAIVNGIAVLVAYLS